MESNDDAQIQIDFGLSKSGVGENPFEIFKKFNRIFTHFPRVEL